MTLSLRVPAERLHRGRILNHQAEADKDGLLFIPSDIEAAVIEEALTKVDKESGMRTDLEHGMPATTAFAKHGVL